MSSVIQHKDAPTDWYEEFCQRLEVMRQNAHQYADKDEVVPPDWAFAKVRNEVQNIRKLAGFPPLSVPDVWLGPEGDIGLTWDFGDRSLDLIFGWGKFTARLTDSSKQQLIEQNDVPKVLAQMAA